MQPPWIAFPDIARDSIGWRLGDGVDYLDAFHRMLDAMAPDDRAEYEANHPEPPDWDGLYARFRQRPWC